MIPLLLALSSEPQLIPTPVELCADVKTVLQEAVQAEVIVRPQAYNIYMRCLKNSTEGTIKRI